MKSRWVTLAVVAAVLGMPMLGAQPKHVFLFTIDSCRSDRFGIYGNPDSPTPNIDRWAGTGVVFRNSYSVSAWTAPGLASILTGLYPPTHGIDNRDKMGSPDLVTLARIFRGRGFETPNLNFFTFAPYYTHLGLGEIQRKMFGAREGEELINWLRSYRGPRPFFLWYHTTMVHQPYDPGNGRLPAPRAELLEREGIKAAMTGAIVPLGSTRFEPSDRRMLEGLYDGELTRMDELFSQALRLLEEKGLLDDTLIILTADHGEELLDHGFIGHASTSLNAKLYEEFIRIPLIVSWPNGLEGKRSIQRRATQVDLLPSILKLFGFPIPPDAQGLNLFDPPGEPGQARILFFDSVIAGNQTTRERQHLWVGAVLKGELKYIDAGERGRELYDLREDPGETINLVSQRSREAGELKEELERWRRQTRDAGRRMFPEEPALHSSLEPDSCPVIAMPQPGQKLNYDDHTGSLLFSWSGDLERDYQVEYDIGTGDHHVAGIYDVKGNYQVLGPFPAELWGNLKAWNPFKIRVSPKGEKQCWSTWVDFEF